MKLDDWKLDKLAVSPSLKLDGPELISEAAPSPAARANLSALFCCSSWVNCSTGRASRIFSVTVGSKASTVNVQSVWF
jgi:hypothetical protein